MVSTYSYKDKVKPTNYDIPNTDKAVPQTIYFVVILHKEERIVVNIAKELHVWSTLSSQNSPMNIVNVRTQHANNIYISVKFHGGKRTKDIIRCAEKFCKYLCAYARIISAHISISCMIRHFYIQ